MTPPKSHLLFCSITLVTLQCLLWGNVNVKEKGKENAAGLPDNEIYNDLWVGKLRSESSHGTRPQTNNFNKDPYIYNNQREFKETETSGKDQIMRLSFKT